MQKEKKMKSYTDIEQSEKLAEILPLKSADMHYFNYSNIAKPYIGFDVNETKPEINNDVYGYIPCWSLAALLDILPNYQMQTQDDGIGILCSCNGKFNIITADNSVDVCYELILKLHALKMI